MMRFLLELIYPRRAVCMGCGSMIGCERRDVCNECRQKLAKDWIGVRHTKADSGLDCAAFAHSYRGVAGNLVRKLKYSSVRLLAEEMGADVARAAQMLRIEQIDFVTAVPMHPKRLRKRGYNHGEELAKSVAQYMGLKYAPLLKRRRNDAQQANLNLEKRRRNLIGAFEISEEYQNKLDKAVVLLIDDVYTTGATAKACSEALRAAGVGRLYFAAYTLSEGEKRRRKDG